MKKFLSLVMVFALIGSVAITAQQHAPKNGKKGERHEMKQGPKPMVSATVKAERIANELGLTEAEKVKVQALFEKQDAKHEQHLADMKKIKAEQVAKAEIESKAMKADLEKIIGAEKFQKLTAKKATFQERMKGERKHPKQMMQKKHQKKQRNAPEAHVSPAKIAERMAKELELTDAQKVNVQALLEKQLALRKSSKAEIKKFMDDKKVQMEANGKLVKAEMEKIVGAEKLQKMHSKKAEMQKRMMHKSRNGKMEMMMKMHNKMHGKMNNKMHGKMNNKMHNNLMKPNPMPQISPEKMAERMAKELGLSDTEKANVQALFQKQAEKRRLQQADVKKIKDAEMAKAKEVRKMNDAELMKIIGAEKFKKFESLRSDRMDKVKDVRRKR